jgi:transcriptional regulator with XRE-family HTH domain
MRSVRVARGWTLEKLAVESGVSVGQISLIERGLLMPRLDTLYRLAVALGLTEMAEMLHPYLGNKRGGTAAGSDQEPQDDPAPEVNRAGFTGGSGL